jgi:hypothetical protein
MYIGNFQDQISTPVFNSALSAQSLVRPIDRQCNGQKNKNKWTHNNIQYTTQKTKDWALRALLNTGVEI